MDVIITPEFKDFSREYQFTPAVKKGNFIYTSAIFGSVFNDKPDFLDEKAVEESHLSKIGKILIGKGSVNQSRIIMYHLEKLLKSGGASLADIVGLNIWFMHSVKKTEMIPALQVIKSKFKNVIPPYTLGRMDFPALKGVVLQVSAVAQI